MNPEEINIFKQSLSSWTCDEIIEILPKSVIYNYWQHYKLEIKQEKWIWECSYVWLKLFNWIDPKYPIYKLAIWCIDNWYIDKLPT